tara:strand:- start:1205 stop:1939 length:735 start_codon:yes stop_codon:yes gene_type:complete
MNHIKHLSLIIIFLTSCTSDVTDNLDANLLISPDFDFSTQFFECKLNKGFNLINLESFISDLVREGVIENTEANDFKIYFPKSEYVDQFIMALKNYTKNDAYTKFIDNLSNRGFDEIASCKYDKNELMGVSLFISDLEIEKSSYSAELLRCIYNEGYNFGTFRIAIERFTNQINLLNIPYEALYIESNQSSEDFIWINNYYSKDFSNEISAEWLNNTETIDIKDEFLENAKCVDAKLYDVFKIS